MAYSYPISLSDFFADMPLMGTTMQLAESRIQSGETGAGEILTATVGNRLWGGEVTFQPMYFEDADAVSARISILEESGSTFFFSNPSRSGPRADPNGSILGASTPQISSVASNNRDLLIKSLPSGYVLGPGDEAGWQYGSNPTRYALHRVVKGGVASVGGQLTVELSPRIRSGAVADMAITLINPICKAMIVPGSFNSGSYADGIVTGMKFSWQQTLR